MLFGRTIFACMQTIQHIPTRLSVNINKIALIRNARGGNLPDLRQIAIDCEAYGAEGITVHPRPDQRHIRYNDIPVLREVVKTEFNIEGNPTSDFMDLVLMHKPDQCTLVPDAPDVLTSDGGWDTMRHKSFLIDITRTLQSAGIRVSIFIDPNPKMVEGAAVIGADRVELYTGDYAFSYLDDRVLAIRPHQECARVAHQVGIGLNAGHDLNLENLKFYRESIPNLAEVSIGHALVCDSLYFGLENTLKIYKRLLA